MDDSIEDMDMANIQARWEDNAPGKYYVDQNCIICNICMELAPRNFAESAAGDHHVVCKQPDSMEEEEQIRRPWNNARSMLLEMTDWPPDHRPFKPLRTVLPIMKHQDHFK